MCAASQPVGGQPPCGLCVPHDDPGPPPSRRLYKCRHSLMMGSPEKASPPNTRAELDARRISTVTTIKIAAETNFGLIVELMCFAIQQ
uniref:Uncharacterized protein n=1 Tax=Triticum urartu TaxID=4572 RepID=A0A8R7UNV9_TRIUA